MNIRSRPSAGGVILTPDRKIIVVEQSGNSWSFPKGGIEEGETPLEAAIREIKEETGITELEYIRELGSYERYSIAKDGVSDNKEFGLQKKIFFLFTTPTAELPSRSPDTEITDVRAVTLDEAYELLTHPRDKEFLKSVWHILEQ